MSKSRSMTCLHTICAAVLTGAVFFLLSCAALAEDCFDMAGKDAAIDPDLLRAIAWQESGLHYQAIGKNPVSGYGIGLMQIDSQHLTYMNNRGIDRELLLSDICTNIYSGTLILAQAFNRWGATWEAVGAYNAGFAMSKKQHYRRMAYARKIHATYWKIKRRKGNDHCNEMAGVIADAEGNGLSGMTPIGAGCSADGQSVSDGRYGALRFAPLVIRCQPPVAALPPGGGVVLHPFRLTGFIQQHMALMGRDIRWLAVTGAESPALSACPLMSQINSLPGYDHHVAPYIRRLVLKAYLLLAGVRQTPPFRVEQDEIAKDETAKDETASNEIAKDEAAKDETAKNKTANDEMEQAN